MSPWLAAGGPILPGMLVRHLTDPDPAERRVVLVGTPMHPDHFLGAYCWEPIHYGVLYSPCSEWGPVDTDGATIGAMLAEVRRVYEDRHAYVRTQDRAGSRRWSVYVMQTGFRMECGPVCGDDGSHLDGATEVEALAAAWKAGPK